MGKGDVFVGVISSKEEEFLTPEDIARMLRRNIATIQRWCREGELPAARIGRHYLVRRADFEKWFESKLQRQEEQKD